LADVAEDVKKSGLVLSLGEPVEVSGLDKGSGAALGEAAMRG
jgi:hypothetical protein